MFTGWNSAPEWMGGASAPGYPPDMPLDPDTLLAPSDVARAWGMSTGNVTLMIRDGKLPAERDEQGRYSIKAAELSARPIVVEIDGPAAEAGKVTPEEAAELQRRQAVIDEAEQALADAIQDRDAYVAYLADSEGEVRRDPIDVGRYLPGDPRRRAEHMHRSTVHRIVAEQRDRRARNRQ
jgi:hypothetical protein